MNLFSNKKELEHGFLQIDESAGYGDIVKNVTMWYYPNSDKRGLFDWQSQINFEIQAYDENGGIQKVEIWEFRSQTVDHGYGTTILKEFFTYFIGKHSQPILVVGELSDIDGKDEINRQRREHIYQKFGFEFVRGRIEKLIN